MRYTIPRSLTESDSNWKPSFGADLPKLHWRNRKLHATCRPNDVVCEIHEDTHDPYDFPIGTVKHLWEWNKPVTLGLGIVGLDLLFNHGRLTKKALRMLNF